MAVSIKASRRGLALVDKARRERGWRKSQDEWIETSGLAQATFKRFWSGQPIRRESFIAICEAVGAAWEEVADAETTPDLPGVREAMKRLYRRCAELELSPERLEALHEDELESLCYGWLFELMTLMIKGVETADPGKSFHAMTLRLIHKVGTLFESFYEEEAEGFLLEVRVKNEPGALHEVTGAIADQKININQIHVVADEADATRAVLKIYCQPTGEKEKRELELNLERLPKVVRADADAYEKLEA